MTACTTDTAATGPTEQPAPPAEPVRTAIRLLVDLDKNSVTVRPPEFDHHRGEQAQPLLCTAGSE
jgi:hypothetical protein